MAVVDQLMNRKLNLILLVHFHDYLFVIDAENTVVDFLILHNISIAKCVFARARNELLCTNLTQVVVQISLHMFLSLEITKKQH